ncbi:hypothetical protein SLEP1_g9836 [Rubroshorea leprosula]|uniref:Uncharacterized protein n=1 Tax=Rubroshorea leprosula TaxID=152421 RepID=A0AAV5IHH6_9ROSI|nr:hypothetical protein SLEP1_g9836 [Rubroshorea leprosula]
MAAAEARAVWQRTANRCFVQEDAKRAPKLACCQSSTTSSKQSDSSATGAADTPDHTGLGFMPLNWNPSYANLPPDTRWWLQLQPCYGHHKGLTHDQLIALESEIESLKANIEDSLSIESGDNPSDKKDATGVDKRKCTEYRASSIETDWDATVRKQELKAFPSKTTKEFLELTDTGKKYKLEMEPVEFPVSKKSRHSSFDPVSPWVGGDKTEPWWRTTDKDELASLVAQKSLDYIENCDLPPLQKMQAQRYPHDEASSLDWKAQTGCITSPMVNAPVSPDSEGSETRHRASVEEGNRQGSDKLSSTTHKDIMETHVTGTDPAKAQLLEALCHSQTRAREAENAAKQAYAEKEHVIQLFFRQASQLFAYKQWLQMLQLEAFYFHVKQNGQPISTFFPAVLPWKPYKGRVLWKNCQKGKRRKQVRPRPNVTKYTLAFALGLSLVGAGLLLGWTIGWMLPF